MDLITPFLLEKEMPLSMRKWARSMEANTDNFQNAYRRGWGYEPVRLLQWHTEASTGSRSSQRLCCSRQSIPAPENLQSNNSGNTQ